MPTLPRAAAPVMALILLSLVLGACATAPTSAPAPAPVESRASDESLAFLDEAEAALAAGDLVRAEFYLEAAREDLPRAARSRYQRALADLDRLRSDPGAMALADVQTFIEDREQFDSAAVVNILQRLETVPSSRLTQVAQQPDRLGQWATLALDVRETLLRQRDLLEAAQAWRVLNPLHPVDEAAYLEIAWQYGQRFVPPSRVAVLLPDSGSLEAAGAAIRDGLVSAWLERPTRSELTFLSVGEDPASAVRAYREAEAQGFQFVIGPLRRESVQLVMDQPGASLPALLLNWPERVNIELPFEPATPAPPPTETDWYSLSLSQEAEAQDVAKHMLAQGHRRAILLLAEGGWGERTEAAFMDAFLAGGGEVVSLERFRSDEADHSEKLTRLLQIEDGRERRRRLQSVLNLPLEFEDSRRDDFGAFFMAADPALGRQLKPQLRFFDAGSKPVFAMSRVYGGRMNPSVDVDLDGVVFPATRWALEQDPESPVTLDSLRGGGFSALHALGRDAWNLLPWLDLMARDREFAYPGEIGNLLLADDGRLERTPAWAVFRRGRPVDAEGGP